MKRRAGIFDPWRQDPPPQTSEPSARKRQPEPDRDGAVIPPRYCIQFDGLRAGVHVWTLAEGDAGSAQARSILVDLVHRIAAREGVSKILQSWGIFLGTPPQANPVVLVAGDKKMTISAPAEDRVVPRAIDNLALALREVSQQFSDVRDLLVALKIRPYVK